MKKFKPLPFTEHTQFIFKSMLAGVLISLAAGVYLLCQNTIENASIAKVTGAFLFSLGLIAVIVLNANLYTGKVGYVKSKNSAIRAFWMLILNIGVAFMLGLLFRGIDKTDINPFGPGSPRFEKSWYQMLFDAFGCGVLIYLAVELRRRMNSFLPVVLCVMAFVISGAEHCVADAFYLAVGQITPKGLGHLGLAIAGNTIGSMAIRWLQIGAEKEFDVFR